MTSADMDDIIDLERERITFREREEILLNKLQETKVKLSILQDVRSTAKRIRLKHPAVQDAWEQYRIMYRLHI